MPPGGRFDSRARTFPLFSEAGAREQFCYATLKVAVDRGKSGCAPEAVISLK